MGLIVQPYEKIALFCYKVFFLNSFFDFVYPISFLSALCSMSDGMLVVSAIFPTLEDLGSKLVS